MGSAVHMNTNPQYRGTRSLSDPVAMLNPLQGRQSMMTVLGERNRSRKWVVMCT